jgi:hypothetical protein
MQSKRVQAGTGMLSTPQELSELAHDRADKYAPRTTMRPLRAATIGLIATSILVGIFFRHVKPSDFAGVALALLPLGFLLPLAYVCVEDLIHRRAWAREYEALKAINDGVAASRAACAWPQ